jgi:uncharacterized protein
MSRLYVGVAGIPRKFFGANLLAVASPAKAKHMLQKMFSSRAPIVVALILGLAGSSAAGSACVWKVSGPSGGTLYLGGSIHALKGSDYPLPAAYVRAFDASSRLVFEIDPRDAKEEGRIFQKTGQYSTGDSLKKHVDPRTYDYVRRVFKLMGVSEEKFSKFRPWALVLLLQSPSSQGLSGELGVEGYLKKRARENPRQMSGLESSREHIDVFAGLTERQSEALLLVSFIAHEQAAKRSSLIDAWRRGDIETIRRDLQDGFRDFPAMNERLLGARNRRWIPKIENYLRSGQTYFVVAGAGHMGGSDGLVALLRSRGYQVDQL